MSARRQDVDDALTRLSRLHPRKIDLSLGRLQRLLAALGNPQNQLPPTIHVAGTNGKGSTCAYLAHMARANGQKVHIYTSPHLVDFNERIQIDSQPVGDQKLIEAFARCEAANFGEPITFFEITTAAAFLLFSEHRSAGSRSGAGRPVRRHQCDRKPHPVRHHRHRAGSPGISRQRDRDDRA